MDMPHQTVMAELMIEHFSTIFVRYLQAHHISPGPSARRPRRRVEHVYATVPELVAEVAALNARDSADVQPASPPPVPPLPADGVRGTPLSMSPATPRSRAGSSERILAAGPIAPESDDDGLVFTGAVEGRASMTSSPGTGLDPTLDESEHGDV